MGASAIPLQVGAGVQPIQSPAQAAQLAGAVAIQKQVQQENNLKIMQQQQAWNDQQEMNAIISSLTPQAPAPGGSGGAPTVPSSSGAQTPATSATPTQPDPGFAGLGTAPSLAGATSKAALPAAGVSAGSAMPAVSAPSIPPPSSPTISAPDQSAGGGMAASKSLIDQIADATINNPRISYAAKMATIQHSLDLQKAIAANTKETIANTSAQNDRVVGLIEGVLQDPTQGNYLAARAQAISEKIPNANQWPVQMPSVADLTQARTRYMLGSQMWKDAPDLADKQKAALAEFAQQMPAITKASDPSAAYQQALGRAPWYIRPQLPPNFTTDTIDTVMKMGLAPKEQITLPGELAESDQKVRGNDASKLATAAAKGPEALSAALAALPADRAQVFQGLTTPSDILRAGLKPEEAIKIPQARTPDQWATYVNSVIPASRFPQLNDSIGKAVQFAVSAGGVAGQENAQKAVAQGLSTINDIAKETDPTLRQSKIDAAVKQAQALAPIEVGKAVQTEIQKAKLAPGALSGIIDPSIRNNVEREWAKADDALQQKTGDAQRLQDFVDAARSGNQAAAGNIPLAELRELVNRVNTTELKAQGGQSVARRVDNWISTGATGKPTEAQLKDVEQLSKMVLNGAVTTRNGTVSRLNQMGAKIPPAAPALTAASVGPLPTKLSASDVGKIYTSPKTGEKLKITGVNPKDPTQFKSEVVP
jgi:hypothetical protein